MSTRTFWTRITLASVLLNLPVAVAVVIVGIPLVAGVAASGILGVGALTVVDRQRSASVAAAATEQLMELRVTGTVTALEAQAPAPVGTPA